MHVRFVDAPSAPSTSRWYPGNRSPLVANPLTRLPLGAVRARGWLLHMLELMRDGMTGHLTELSDFLADSNGWFGGDEPGWEEQPYWLRGFYDLGVLLDDARIQAEAGRWIEAVFASQDDEGYFGATMHKAHEVPGGTAPDLWPHMVMLDAVIAHHEATGDERVLPLMRDFFEWCRRLSDEELIPALDPEQTHWKLRVQRDRSGDMIPHLHWYFNQTGERWVLPLARRFFEAIKPPEDEWLDRHIVNFTQRFSYQGLYSAQTGESWRAGASEFWYRQHMATWGQQPRGIFAADERVRSGKVDPRQGFETCGMVEFAKSFSMLGRLSGDTLWADRTEDIMLNHFPAASDPWMKGLHYLTASNQPQLDAGEEHDFFNKGRQICYSPHIYRCCQHNVAMGWPWYVRNLWQATCDDGLAAWLYASSEVTARVGERGDEVRMVEETDYPFSGKLALRIESGREVAFPLYLRVPGWATSLLVEVNGEVVTSGDAQGPWLRIERIWRPDDTVEVELGMKIGLTQWPRHGGVTVDRGPLSYSVKIGERWERCGGTDAWPEWEVFPTTPWDWALAIDRDNPARDLRVVEVSSPGRQPWTPDTAPIVMEARGRRIPDWQIGEDGTVEEIPCSPVKSHEAEGTVTMIPMGCARLRMSVLPVVEE